MANEINFTYRLSINNGSFTYGGPDRVFNITQTNKGGCKPGKVAIATSATNISLSGLTAAGLTEITNLSTANYVDIDCTIRLKPGESYVVRIKPGTTPAGTANTAAVDVQFNCMED